MGLLVPHVDDGYFRFSEKVDQKARTPQYILNYPNFEVKEAFITYLFESFTQNDVEKALGYKLIKGE